jgi:hypothetical protein
MRSLSQLFEQIFAHIHFDRTENNLFIDSNLTPIWSASDTLNECYCRNIHVDDG